MVVPPVSLHMLPRNIAWPTMRPAHPSVHMCCGFFSLSYLLSPVVLGELVAVAAGPRPASPVTRPEHPAADSCSVARRPGLLNTLPSPSARSAPHRQLPGQSRPHAVGHLDLLYACTVSPGLRSARPTWKKVEAGRRQRSGGLRCRGVIRCRFWCRERKRRWRMRNGGQVIRGIRRR